MNDLKPISMPLRLLSALSIVLILGGCNSQLQLIVTATPRSIAAVQAPTSTLTPSPIPATPTLAATPTPAPSNTPPPAPTATPTESLSLATCDPTPADAEGPFYIPGAPERTSVGQGHLLRGVVRSSAGCIPIAQAQVEFWLAGPDGQYSDDYRATLFTGEAGSYTFESNFPPSYGGRPAHIHIKVTAKGYQSLITQYYPAAEQSEGEFDLILIPAPAQGEATVPAPTLFDTAWSERAIFQPGLIDTEHAVLNQLPSATIYHIDLHIDDVLTQLHGQEELLYTNQEEEALSEIYLRLFPNILDGSATIANLTLNNQPVEPIFELRNSAARLPLPTPLLPGQQAALKLDFTITVPNKGGGNYGIYAFLEEILALAHFYPMVAVYDDQGWNVEIPPRIGDVLYADTSFYLVRVTAPVSQTLVASGLEIERQTIDGLQVVTFAAGPVRDFYLAASDRYAVVSQATGQTTVKSYAPAEFIEGAKAALDQAIKAIESFNARFGPYPFTEFDIVATTNFALGIEYPGIIALLVDLYKPGGQVRSQSAAALMEGVVAHEVGHQWFYSLIGNDQVNEPWLDEALAQYATLIYYNDIYGQGSADGFRSSLQRRWARINQADIPIGRPVRDYSVEEYSAIVYGRGPLFIEALAETMGQATFAEFLRDYVQSYRWGIATGADFKRLAEQHCNCDLTTLFEEWVY